MDTPDRGTHKPSAGEAGHSQHAHRGGDASDHAGLPDALFVDRVRLYLKVLFFINLFFVVTRVGLELAGVAPGEAQHIWRSFFLLVGLTALTGMAWFAVVRSRPPMRAAMGVEALTTLLVTAHYARTIFDVAGDTADRPEMAILMIATIVLVLRASLVPSPAIVTAVLGGAVVCGIVVASLVMTPDIDVFSLVWAVALGLVVIAVTTVTSGTIYGLQRKMHAARRLGQYKLERKLGHGGMGQVYLARHSMLQRQTAVKLLTSVTSATARARFRREVQTASGLSHPNTIEIYDYGRSPEGAFYFAMEYVEGATLASVVAATGPMPASRVLRILRQTAGSLGEAHARGLVHRDIKPQNLMLCERGGEQDTVKVLDFGLVQELATTATEAEQQLTGTPLYLAPETILEANGFGTESDVYALGAVGYFLLTGQPPFAGSLLDVLADHLATQPDPLPASHEVPDLAAFIMKCLSKDPSDRPATALVVLEALDRLHVSARWGKREAALWWAEHRDIVDRGRPTSGASPSLSMDHLSVGRTDSMPSAGG